MIAVKRLCTLSIVLLLACSQFLWADKWALLIGINDYPNFPPVFQLRGCENDISLMKTVLMTKYGFPEQNIRSILSREGTKANIVMAIQEWLIENPKTGDVVVFYYSGHGIQVEDEDGDEADGYDEALCPTDLKPDASRTEFLNFLRDDELDELLSQIPTDNVTVIFDCCHSGTAIKDLRLEPVEMSKSKVIDRDLALKPKLNRKPPAYSQRREGTSIELSNPNHVVITGCKDDQVSQEREWYSPEVGSFRSGVLTKHLVDELNRSQLNSTYFELMTRVRKQIGQIGADAIQTPQLHGDIDLPVFSPRQPDGDLDKVSVATKPNVFVTDTTNGKIIINAGLIHGITKGSVYTVYPPEEMAFASRGFAKIRISEVGLDTATAIVIEGHANSITSMCRAFEVQHAFLQDNLYLHIDANPHQIGQFEQHLDVENVIFVQEEGRADFSLRVESRAGNVTGKLISADGWIVSEVSGQSTENLADQLRRILEREVLIKQLHSFRNPSPPFDLKVWVDKGTNATYKIGETISMAFRAKIEGLPDEGDCYLILLNVDSEGYVTLMFPNKYQSDNKIIWGQIYTIPSHEMKFKMTMRGPPGRELIVALATTEQLSHPLFQTKAQRERFPDLTGARLGTELIRILDQSLQGENVAGSSVSLPTNRWVTDSLIIVSSP
jgi:hypothetical protein